MDVNLNIDEKDILQVKDYLKEFQNPVDLDDIVNRIALFKTRETRSHKVKLYNPNCEYKVGDLIYKEYPGKIPVGSKKYIEIDSGVVLKVEDIRTRFGLNEIILKYEGTSEFKKYTSYLDRQKIELLLPHKQKPIEKPEYLPEENDPRKQNDPLERRELATLKRKLAGSLNKDNSIALICEKVLLIEHLKEIEDQVFDKIREFLSESKKSETTEFFVEHFARIKPTDENFDAYCFSLSYRMLRDYKIDFQQTQETGWGKWNLISVIYYMKKDSPISEPNPLLCTVTYADKKNLSHRRRKFEESLFQDTTMKFFLTQREITAGAVKLKQGFFDLGDTIEVQITDAKQKKNYLVYYYKDEQLMLGFKEIFERYKAIQSSIVTFEMSEPSGDDQKGHLLFSLRTTKKGTISDRIEYSAEEKAFKVVEEKQASPIFVNKAMFLESTVFQKIYEELDNFRKVETFNKLVHKVFLEFGVKERNYEIHFLRLYHILDLIFPTDLKLVEDVILSNPEFIPAEKMAGVFYLDSGAVVEIEEEETKRKEIEIDEIKKKREELRRKKQEQERKIKEEIRHKREERRKKREEEMWQKERLKKGESIDPDAVSPEEPVYQTEETVADMTAPTAQREPAAASTSPESAPAYKQPETPEMADDSAKKDHAKKTKKRIEEEKPQSKPAKRGDRKIQSDEDMSEDDIKSQIELEKLKDEMSKRKEKEAKDKKKKIAYQDKNTGFGGILASKLDQIVKKEDSGDKK